jgi:hypothetical protein
MLAKAKNGHTNIWYILLLNFVATYNIRSSTQDSEKEIVLCKKGDDITRFDGIRTSVADPGSGAILTPGSGIQDG